MSVIAFKAAQAVHAGNAFEQFQGHRLVFCQGDGKLGQIQRIAHIPAALPGDEVHGIRLHRHASVISLWGFQRSSYGCDDVFVAERAHLKEVTAGTDGRIDAVQGIGRRCADQCDAAVFHMRQQQVLFVLVQPVNLIDDQHEARKHLRFRKERIQLFFCTVDGIEDAVWEIDLIGQHDGQRRLSHAGRTIEDHGKQCFFFCTAPQDTVFTDEMLLPDHLIERLRTHTVCKRFFHFDHRTHFTTKRTEMSVIPDVAFGSSVVVGLIKRKGCAVHILEEIPGLTGSERS